MPLWLLIPAVALASAVSAYAVWRSQVRLQGRALAALLGLRQAAVLLVGVMLLCPGWTVRETDGGRSQVVFLVDRSQSMATRDVPPGRSRLEAACAFVEDLDLGGLGDVPRHLVVFSDAAVRVEWDGLAGLQAAGGTDLAAAIGRVDQDLGLNRVAALVVVSDGLDHSGFAGDGLTVPLFAVSVGSGLAQARDLGFVDVTAPATVQTREEWTAVAGLRMTGVSTARTVPIEVRVDGEPKRDDTVELTPGVVRDEAVSHTFDVEGLHRVRLATGRLEREVSYLNNHLDLVVEVVRAQDQVAAYFPLLTAGLRPLLRELEQDPDQVFTACYRLGEGRFQLRGYRINPVFRDGLPKRAAQLADVRCLVLGAHNGGLITPAEGQVLDEYVRAGGSLVLLGGADSFGPLGAGSALEAMSPVRHLAGGSFLPGRFRVEVPPDADSGFARRVGEIVAANGDAPEFVLRSVNRVAEVKPAARVVCHARADSRLPLVVWQPHGRGKVVALLTNSLHMWGDREHRRENFRSFWRQLVALCRGDSAERDLLDVGVDRRVVPAGEPVRVTARLRGPERPVALSAVLESEAGGEPAPLGLRRAGEGWSGESGPLAVGRYRLTVRAVSEGEVLRERFVPVSVGEDPREASQLAVQDDRFLRFTGRQRLFRAHEGERLAGALGAAVRRAEVQRESLPMFESPWLLLAVVACLLGEWMVRRRCNMV